jgi:hypothetical protein
MTVLAVGLFCFGVALLAFFGDFFSRAGGDIRKKGFPLTRKRRGRDAAADTAYLH